MPLPENALSRLVLRIVLLVSLVAPFGAQGQATGDPIPSSAPIASWTLVLEDVVRIPDSAGSPPRLEQLVGNATTGLAYVIDQRGTIYAFDPTAATPVASVFLDLAAQVGGLETGNESGVRSMAFHPDFDDPARPGYRKLYTSLSRSAASLPVGQPVVFDSPGALDHWTVVGEWTLTLAGAVDPASYRELLRIEQPFANHNSGHLGFDPTAQPGTPGYAKLFVSVGDGGSLGGPFDLSQDIDTTPVPYPHGKILRIDPLAAGAAPYTVPGDNPFAAQADRLGEIWAYGFRNPHTFEWDSVTGRLYVSDIGQGVIEELSVVRRGGNYGWNLREGAYVYLDGSNVSPLPSGHPSDEFLYPVAQYDHQGNGLVGSAAIVGGPVYRGNALPELSGTMLFADFSNGPGPIFAVHVSQLVERDDFGAISSLSDGRLAPYEEVLITDSGVDKTFRQFLRDANGSPTLGRTDLRWGTGPDREIYVLDKRDGWVRRLSDVLGHPGPPLGVPALSGVGRAVLLGSMLLGALGLRVAWPKRASSRS